MELPRGSGEGQEVGAATRLAGEPSLPWELMFKEKVLPSGMPGRAVYHLLELSTAPGSSPLPGQEHEGGRMEAASHQDSLGPPRWGGVP